jgi:hypothetical protein
MSKNKKAKPVDRAEPTIKQATVTDTQKVSVAHSTTASMAKSPLWATAPAVQSAAKDWNDAASPLARSGPPWLTRSSPGSDQRSPPRS